MVAKAAVANNQVSPWLTAKGCGDTFIQGDDEVELNLQSSEEIKQAVTKQTEDQISKMYADLAKQVEEKAQSYKGLDGVSDQLKKTYLHSLAKELKAASNSLGTGLEKTIESSMVKTSKGVVIDAQKFLDKVGYPSAPAAYKYVPQDVIKAITSGAIYGGDWTLSQSIWGINAKFNQDINSVIAQGLALNKSTYDIAKDIEKYVDPSARKDWSWSKVYPNTNKTVDYSAQRLARTLVQHAYQQSLVNTTAKNPFVTGYRWISAETERTCQLCRDRNDVVYSKNDLPLDHPNGLCSFAAEITQSYDEIADRLAAWVNGKNDPELDTFEDDFLSRHDVLASQGTVQFDAQQAKWLGSHGYTPDNMPIDFNEWSHTLTSQEKAELFEKLNLSGESHPFQKMQQWYESQLTVIKKQPLTMSLQSKPVDVGDAFTQARKDGAYWFKVKSTADDVMRDMSGTVWQAASAEERRAIYDYTAGSGFMNRPLRGYDGSWSNFVGVGKVSLNNENPMGASKIQDMTNLISRSSYNFDIWLNRGVETREGAASFLGISVDDFTGLDQKGLEEKLLGKVVQDQAFTSCGTAKGEGFSGPMILNIYCPRGTQMMYAEPISFFGDGDKLNWDGVSKQYNFSTEDETILQRGTMFRVTKVEKGYNTTYIDVEVVGQSCK